MRLARLAVSVGCPCGVGPEVAVVAAAACTAATCVLVGDTELLRRAARARGVAVRRVKLVGDAAAIARLSPGDVGVWMPSTALASPSTYGRPRPTDGAAQLAWIDEATALVTAGWADALVTGPVSKHAIATSGSRLAARFRGHTEHLAAGLGAREVVMAFHAEALTTALVTTHLPLARVPRAVTPAAVATTVTWLARLLRALGRRRPSLVVAALNPHAGEGGLLGREETTRLLPGIAVARRRLARLALPVTIVGPVGAETAFRVAAQGGYDGVVAMYHDQATIPSKLLGFGEAVNVTLGLPIVRTSVDHGTGYDRAGRGTADARGMLEAMGLAAVLAPKGRWLDPTA